MENNRFTWKEGEIEVISDDTLEKNVIIYNTDGFHPFRECAESSSCQLCEDDDVEIGMALAEKIYESYFLEDTSEDLVRRVLDYLVNLCKKLLKDEVTLTKQIWCATRTALYNKLNSDARFDSLTLGRVFSEV